MPAQGPVDHRCSVVDAGRFILCQEITSVKREHPHCAPLIDWNNPVYVGSGLNVFARGGRQKFVHALLFRATTSLPALKVSEKAGSAVQWVYSLDCLEKLLASTAAENPLKAGIITAMALTASKQGWFA